MLETVSIIVAATAAWQSSPTASAASFGAAWIQSKVGEAWRETFAHDRVAICLGQWGL